MPLPETMAVTSETGPLATGFIMTALGMGVTFIVLVLLLFCIAWMQKLQDRLKKPSTGTRARNTMTTPLPTVAASKMPGPAGSPASVGSPAKIEQRKALEEEVVAAIIAAIAISMKTSTDHIVVKNIQKIEDQSPAWNRAGLLDQMNSRL